MIRSQCFCYQLAFQLVIVIQLRLILIFVYSTWTVQEDFSVEWQTLGSLQYEQKTS